MNFFYDPQVLMNLFNSVFHIICSVCFSFSMICSSSVHLLLYLLKITHLLPKPKNSTSSLWLYHKNNNLKPSDSSFSCSWQMWWTKLSFFFYCSTRQKPLKNNLEGNKTTFLLQLLFFRALTKRHRRINSKLRHVWKLWNKASRGIFTLTVLFLLKF